MTQPTLDQAPGKQMLERIYQEHHQRGQRYGYLFCHGARGPYLQEAIGTGKKVLDIGCRDGELTKFYAQGNQVVGLDVDRHALKLAEKKLGITTLWADVNEEFPFPEESFDATVACEIMEHVYHTHPFLENIYRVLKPGGLFMGSVPNAFRMRNRLKFLLGKEYESDPTHMHQFSPERLTQHLLEFFGDVEIIPIGGKVLPFLPVSSNLPRRLNRLFAKDLLWKARKGG